MTSSTGNTGTGGGAYLLLDASIGGFVLQRSSSASMAACSCPTASTAFCAACGRGSTRTPDSSMSHRLDLQFVRLAVPTDIDCHRRGRGGPYEDHDRPAVRVEDGCLCTRLTGDCPVNPRIG